MSRVRGQRIRLTYNGETKTLEQWSEITGIPKDTIYERVRNRGWPVDRALTQEYQPGIGGRKRKTALYEYRGELCSLGELGKKYGVPDERLRLRIKRGWTITEAIETPSGKTPPRLRSRSNGCNGCYHYAPVSESQGEGERCCHYILDTGRIRPCPAGCQCTVKDERPRPPKKPKNVPPMSECSYYYLVLEELRRLTS